jgi:hypothetical protein
MSQAFSLASHDALNHLAKAFVQPCEHCELARHDLRPGNIGQANVGFGMI